MNTKKALERVQRLCGWLALVLIALLVISGYGWDIRTSDLVSHLTAGLLNRVTAADLHQALIIPLLTFLACHVVLSLWRVSKRQNRDKNVNADV
jgi:thiosulfate reductase cytochrome b subunit